MEYAILRNRHANARYDASQSAIMHAELSCIAESLGIDTEVKTAGIGGLSVYVIEAEDSMRTRNALLRAAGIAALFERRGDGLFPLMEGHGEPAFFDLASIQKYKGKTNETFTRTLVNMAAFNCAKAWDDRLTLLDPLCGRGTTLFCALAMGYDSAGIENDKRETSEAVTFLKSYLKNGRFKHGVDVKNVTKNGKSAGNVTTITTAATAEAYKSGDTLSLSIATGDAGNADCFYRKQRPDIIVADLPYGIQHAGDGGKKGAQTLGMMRRILPGLAALLNDGGAVAFSFNSYTLRRDDLRDVCAENGLSPISGNWADGLSHWVEQAVMRDAVIAVKL